MSIVIMSVVIGLCATQLVNPFYIWRIVKGCYLTVSAKGDEKVKKEKKFDLGIDEPLVFALTQIVCFIVAGSVYGIVVFADCMDRTWSNISVALWWPALVNIINLVILWGAEAIEDKEGYSYQPKGLVSFIVSCCIMIIMPIAILIYSEIYTNNNLVDGNICFNEQEVQVLDVDIWKSLEKETIIQNVELDSAIMRNGKVYIPMKREDEVVSPGYIVVEGNKPVVVLKNLNYNPNQGIESNTEFMARKKLPTKIFFGDWSWQIDNNNNVYFAKFYGEYASLRGGRKVEGLITINAENGDFVTYGLKNIPSWIDGISE